MLALDGVTLNGLPETLDGFGDDLVTLRNNFALLHPDDAVSSGTVLLQADARLPVRVVKHAIRTCSKAGYANPSIVVMAAQE